MKKTLNFDNFMSEMNKETITVTVYGKEYEVPAEIPAMIPMMLARAESVDEEMSDAKTSLTIFQAADAMFGKESVDEMCRKGMTSNDMAQLLGQLFTLIQGTDDEEEDGEEFDDVTGKRRVKKAPKK